MMSTLFKKIAQIHFVVILSICLLGVSPSLSQAEGVVIVHYFHSDIRCKTCLAFEDWSKTAVERFPKELKNGTLKWQVINFDEPVNMHYIKDYDLAEKSLVLIREENGKVVKWKNVEEFWDFDEDQKKEFVDLVQALISDYLKN
ncbi:MAG: nitrophenyl compound nitroreductase subunit ArsF family protein [Desulfuromusa sp.]